MRETGRPTPYPPDVGLEPRDVERNTWQAERRAFVLDRISSADLPVQIEFELLTAAADSGLTLRSKIEIDCNPCVGLGKR